MCLSGALLHRKVVLVGVAVLLAVSAAIAIGIGPGSGSDGSAKSDARIGQMTGDGGLELSSEDLGNRWPLTIDGGTLRCDKGAVTLETSKRTYAMNVEAQDRHLGESLAPVWASNPDIEGARMSTGELIEHGLALC